MKGNIDNKYFGRCVLPANKRMKNKKKYDRKSKHKKSVD